MMAYQFDGWLETQLRNERRFPDDPHAGCTGPDHCCPECLAGYLQGLTQLDDEQVALGPSCVECNRAGTVRCFDCGEFFCPDCAEGDRLVVRLQRPERHQP